MSHWVPTSPFHRTNKFSILSIRSFETQGVVTAGIQRLSLIPARATARQHCSLLRLPPEMRIAIYEAASLDESDYSDSSDSIHLLQTCRQINMEAQPVFYQRPKSFTSQAKLFLWNDRSSTSNLERVRHITVQLTDIDLSPLLHQDKSTRSKHITAWSLYQAELDKLEVTLRALPNLASMTIIPPKETQSMLLKEFYRALLAMIPSRCPKLRNLEVHDSDELLRQVPTLSEVPRVTFMDRRARSSESASESSTRRMIKQEYKASVSPDSEKVSGNRKMPRTAENLRSSHPKQSTSVSRRTRKQ